MTVESLLYAALTVCASVILGNQAGVWVSGREFKKDAERHERERAEWIGWYNDLQTRFDALQVKYERALDAGHKAVDVAVDKLGSNVSKVG